MEAPRLIAALTRMVRDVGLAEDLAQDALVIALERWPQAGVPDNPGAWLMGTAKHRAVDLMRRGRMLERKHAEIAPLIDEMARRGDYRLSTRFAASHRSRRITCCRVFAVICLPGSEGRQRQSANSSGRHH